MNRKGFTLVEIVAVIAILGIISGISIPLIIKSKKDEKQKLFNAYESNIKNSSKLYIDSYEDDLFGGAKSGCSVISFKDLNEKGLLKDIKLDDVTCNDNENFVRIVKVNDHYGYSIHLKCFNKNNNSLEYEKIDDDDESCSISDDNVIDISIKDKQPVYVREWNDIEVELSSSTGIYPNNVSLQYAFSTTTNESNIIGTWTPLKYSVPKEEEQYEKIDRGEKITVTGYASTPKGYTGEVYLLVKVLYLKDLVLDNWINLEKDLGQSIVSNNQYLLDNDKPTLNYSKTGQGRGGASVNISCVDEKSGCNQSIYSYGGLKSTRDFTISDKAGNSSVINVPITSYDCSYRDCWTKHECETKQGDAYVCGRTCANQTSWGQVSCWDNYCPGRTWTECYDTTVCEDRRATCYR